MRNTKLLLKIFVSVIVISGVIGYSYYQARDFLTGPSLTILSPQNGATVTDALVNIEGLAKNISAIALNDRPIFVDEEGVFKEQLLLLPGYNIMELTAQDRFGRTKAETLELVLK